MERVKVKLITLGNLPQPLNLQRIKDSKSKVFELTGEIESYVLKENADLENWGYSDELINRILPVFKGAHITVILTRVPLQDSYYTRRLGGNRVVFTLSEISEFLVFEGIPLENAVLRVLYQYVLLYKRLEHLIPATGTELIRYTHDETRGCLFDMNGWKSDIAVSCAKPSVCDDCKAKILNERVSEQFLAALISELKGIRKPLYVRIIGWVKKHPIITFLASSFFALAIGVTGSILASLVYENYIKPHAAGEQYDRHGNRDHDDVLQTNQCMNKRRGASGHGQ